MLLTRCHQLLLWLFPLLLLLSRCSELRSKRPSKKKSTSKPDPPLLPLVISTWNYTQPNLIAWHVLHTKSSNGSDSSATRDAVVQGCVLCQRQQCGRLLGRGAAPDAAGHITLEAALMDGQTLRFGAVAAMEGIRNAIDVARHVLEHTEHTLLVGVAATQFAHAMGHSVERLDTPATQQELQGWRRNRCQPNFWQNVRPAAAESCGPYKPLRPDYLRNWPHEQYALQLEHPDQFAMLAIDARGRMHAASVSNGAPFRIAGRVGDAAVPGAGIYAVDEVGAALSSGDGDVTIRLLPALLAVEALRAGKTPQQAAEGVMRRLLRHHTEFNGGLVVVNKLGQYAAACCGLDEFVFVVSSPRYPTLGRVERIKCIDRYEVVKNGPKGYFRLIPDKVLGAG